MINPRVIQRIIANTDMRTKLRLARVIPKFGRVDELTKCMMCPNMCLHVCPVFDAERRLTVSPSVKSRLGYFSEDVIYDAVYHCLPCDACKNACPMEISVNDALRDVRGRFVSETAKKAVRKFEDEVMKHSKMAEKERRDGKVLYFPGCRTFEARLFSKTVEVLEKLNVDFAVDEVVCCGMPYHELGMMKEFRDAVERLKGVASKYEGVISNCPHCVSILRESGIKAVHLISVLKPVKVGGEFSFHDPCLMARKLGIIEEPRKLLEEMGCSVKETAFSGKDTHCCGYGGVYRILYPELAEKVAKKRKGHFECQIVTACPACRIALDAVDILELIGEGL
ncbi:(Fe-S)-binding protein [Archaeoglobus neptunius]|uniref:(Fe-S)-binding protein n=1 Tax=Archaeoglobus neptunius TaxID=2798580 RepID=UPI00192841C5|nr:(Fe-S)-binding protein [Archaeoglobus neptunius]